ncbi:hypothetical protein A1O1_04571 [Capronia coronata CBS 617.96]|uniref:Uncharacterized protein n=1 Tax=Capronia coronata CBS 617.96 TaxID=1182541 RepID=W9Y4A0_9EURO|nr:uncharacterized protein A1O1_04571 [Capronia coronata CBS 617.96]EXJ87647.1 hypothetical protein A1O1_04571 [Capronia coronata CBS 617.96]
MCQLYMKAADVGKLKGETRLGRYVFFTAPPSYPKNMRETGIHDLVCGRYIRDEFHREPNINNQMMRNARELIMQCYYKSGTTPKIVQMSGTPIRLGARDLVGIASLWSLCIMFKQTG